MTDVAEKLKGEVLRLAEEDRAELAYHLLCSLDDREADDQLDAWEVELDRRWQEMETGVVPGVAAEVALAEMRKKYP